MFSPLPEISFIAFLYWVSIGLICIAFVASGDGGVDAGKDGVSLAWYIILLIASTLSAMWIVCLYVYSPNKHFKLDCTYRAVALSMAIPSVIVGGLAIIGAVSEKFGDQVLLAVLGSFWMVPLILWPSWAYYACNKPITYPNCPFSL